MRYKQAHKTRSYGGHLFETKYIGFKAFLAWVRVPASEEPYRVTGGGKPVVKHMKLC